ncbi:MAG: M23 family metallopeptidase [Polyangiaceae bacterium]
MFGSARTPLPIAVLLGALSTVAFYTLIVVPLSGHHDASPPSIAAITSANAPVASANAANDGGMEIGQDSGVIDAGPVVHQFRVADLATDDTIEIKTDTVGHRAMITALLAAPLSRAQAQRIVNAFERVRSLGSTQPKDSFSIAKTKSGGKVVAFEYQSSKVDVWQAVAADGDAGVGASVGTGDLEAKKLEILLDKKRVTAGFLVGDDLRASLAKSGFDVGTEKNGDSIVTMLDDALDGHAELADIRPGARLRIVATEQRIEGTFVSYAEVDAVEYFPASAHAQPVRTYYSPASKGYFDAKGRQPTHGGWRMPIPFARISSRFNPHRMHPVLHTVMPHNGVDFSAPPGTPIYSTAAGTVIVAGDGGPCGNMVKLEHSGGLVSAYCHMSRFAAGLHVGEHVESRQLVGYVGSTGRATGPHLHFAIKRGDVFIDPLSLKLDGVRLVPVQNRDDFEAARKDLDAALDAIPLPAAPAFADVDAGSDNADDTILETE